MSTPSSFPMSSFPSQQALKRPGTQLPAANPTTPAAFVVTTPKSQPTPSTTNHLPAFSSPGGLRPGASPARRGNLDGKSPAIGTPGRGAKTLPNSTLGVNSPANAQLGITPLLGAGIGSPASFAGLDGLGMKLTMSNLGLSSSALGKMDDDERRRRLETVLTTLRRKPGRISQEGLERLSRRYGFDNMWEADARTGRRTLQMAGSTVLIGVEFRSQTSSVPDSVAVDFASEALATQGDSTAAILYKDLTPTSGASSINATLDKFASNLERLAQMEQLSAPEASCFEAVLGVYNSLKRLYEHEKKTAEVLLGLDGPSARQKIEREVICKQSGRPRANARGKVGLCLDYWTTRSIIPDTEGSSVDVEDESQIFSAIIGCEEVLPALYPTIRVSANWLTEQIIAPDQGIDLMASTAPSPVIDWLDPPVPTSSSTPSHARFVARLEPPLVLPFQTATQIYASVGVDITQDPISSTSMDSLLLSPLGTTFELQQSILAAPRERRTERTLDVPTSTTTVTGNNDVEKVEYALALFTTRPDLARTVTSIPFAHPRQLIALLPTLRQYAAVNALLGSTFASSAPLVLQPSSSILQTETGGEDVEAELAALLGPSYSIPDVTENVNSDLDMDIDMDMGMDIDGNGNSEGDHGANGIPSAESAPPPPATMRTHQNAKRKLDVAFSTLPTPHFTLTMPFPGLASPQSSSSSWSPSSSSRKKKKTAVGDGGGGGGVKQIRFNVNLNGIVEVAGEDVLSPLALLPPPSRPPPFGTTARDRDHDMNDEQESFSPSSYDDGDEQRGRRWRRRHEALVDALMACGGDFAVWGEWVRRRVWAGGLGVRSLK